MDDSALERLNNDGSVYCRVRPKRLTLWNKICFSSGSVPCLITNTAFAVFMNKYLLDVAKIPAHYTSYIVFASLIVGGISNPFFAYFVNKSPITRIGKMKPWILSFVPLCAISYIFMWNAPKSLSSRETFVWYLVFDSLYQISLSGFRIPHQSMTMYLSGCKKERESATMICMFFETASILIAILSQYLVIGDSSGECEKPDKSNITTHNNTTTQHFGLHDRYFTIAVVFASTFLIAFFLICFGVKERTELIVQMEESEKAKRFKTLRHLKSILSYKPFILFCWFSMFGNLAILVVQGYMQLYFEYSFSNAKQYFGLCILVVLTTSIFLLPVCRIMMRKIGEKSTYILGNLTMIPLMIGSIFFTEAHHFWIFISLSVIASMAFTVNLVLPYTMLPKCIDAYYLIYKHKPDALFYTILYFNSKVSLAIYQFIGQYALHIYGYKVNVCAEYQPSEINTVIRMIFAPLPVVFLILSCIFLLFYNIKHDITQNADKIEMDESTNRF